MPDVVAVVRLELVVPREEGERQGRNLLCPDALEPGDQLLPEAGGGPVLDGERRPHRLVVVVAAVEPEQLVAEEQRAPVAVAALAHVVEAQAEGGAEAQQPLEVGRPKAERAALDGPRGRYERRISLAVGVDGSPAGAEALLVDVDDPELVHQDLLALARRVERAGVDHAIERGEQELVGEHRELDGEVPEVIQGHTALGEPGGVGIVHHHRVMHELAVDRVLERLEVLAGHGRPPSVLRNVTGAQLPA